MINFRCVQKDMFTVGLYAEFGGSVGHHSQVATSWKQCMLEVLLDLGGLESLGMSDEGD